MAETLLAIGVLVVLAFFGWLMITRKMTATLALPLAAIAIALVALSGQAVEGGVLSALSTLISEVVEPGIMRLSGAIMAVLLGAVLAAQMKISGAAERIVRYAAEYAGEDRFRLGLLMLVLIAVLFTTLGGLGAVILVASITLPLLFSLGFEPKVAGVLFLLGLSLGGTLNPVNWALYLSVLELSPQQIIPFAVVLAGIFFLVACVYLLYATAGSAGWKRQLAPFGVMLLLAASGWFLVTQFPAAWQVLKHIAAGVLLGLLGLLALLAGVVSRCCSAGQRKRGRGLAQCYRQLAGRRIRACAFASVAVVQPAHEPVRRAGADQHPDFDCSGSRDRILCIKLHNH